MSRYKLSQENLFNLINHLPVYGLDAISVSSEQVDTTGGHISELSGPIPSIEIYHFNSGDQFLETL